MSESGVKDAVARRVVRPHELQQWHRNWNGTPNRKMLEQHNIETAIEYLPRPRQWLSPLSASPAKMRAFYSGDDSQCTRRLRGAILVWEIWLHAGSIEGGRQKGRCDGQGRRGGAETQVVSAKHARAFEDIAYEPHYDRFDPADPTWRRGRLLLRRTRRRRWAGRFAAARPYRLALFWKAKLASAREF